MEDHGDIIFKQKWSTSFVDKFMIGSYYAGIIFFSFLLIFAIVRIDWSIDDDRRNGLILIFTSLLALCFAIIKIREDSVLRYRIYKNGFVYPKRFAKITGKDNYIDYSRIIDISFFNYGFNCNLKLTGGKIVMIREYEGVEPYLIIVRELIKRLNKTEVPDFQMLEKFYSSKNKEIKAMALREFMKTNQSFLHPREI